MTEYAAGPTRRSSPFPARWGTPQGNSPEERSAWILECLGRDEAATGANPRRALLTLLEKATRP